MQKRKRVQVSNKIKLSSAVRTSLIVIAIAIIALGSGNIIKALQGKSAIITESKEIYKYTNQFTSNSKINLIDNQYVDESEVTEKQTYLSDLISTIDMNIHYNYIGTKQANIVYNYKIEAVVSATYLSNNKSYDVLNKTYVLKEVNDTTISAKKDFTINENFSINYAKYHEMIKNFKQDLGINANSLLYIKLTVNTKANVDSKEVTNQYVSNYNISLGEKVATITEKKIDETSDTIKYEQKKNTNSGANVKQAVINLIITFAGIVLLRKVLKKTEKLNMIRNEFKLELNRIMRSCDNKIVQIEDLKHIDISHSTKVTDIEQLLKLSDEALVPIYCYINEEKEEAYFIVTKYEKSYIYILTR